MTTKEIAKLANVSRSTVSRVLNNYSNVPLETKQKVEKVIKEHGYTPNHFARSLAGKTTNIVGIFFADINDTGSSDKWIGINSPYNMEFLAYTVTTLKEKGYVALINVINSLDEIKNIDFNLKNRILHGGIFIGFPHNVKKLEKLSKEYNVVLIDQCSFDKDIKNEMKLVNLDNFFGGYEATKYLIEKGHHNILHIAGDMRLSSLERKKGFLKAIKDYKVKKSYVIEGLYREDIAYDKMKEFLKKEIPSAIFVANDIMYLGVARAIKEKKLKIPNDISIIGFDNLKLSQWTEFNLTTMEAPLEEVSKKAVELILNKEPFKHIMFKPKLIEKDSVINNSSHTQ